MNSLSVVSLAHLVSSRVSFRLLARTLTTTIPTRHFRSTCVSVVPTGTRLIVGSILRSIDQLLLARVRPNITRARINRMVFRVNASVLTPFGIVTLHLLSRGDVHRGVGIL